MAGNLDRAIDRLIALQDLLQLKRDITDLSYGEIGTRKFSSCWNANRN